MGNSKDSSRNRNGSSNKSNDWTSPNLGRLNPTLVTETRDGNHTGTRTRSHFILVYRDQKETQVYRIVVRVSSHGPSVTQYMNVCINMVQKWDTVGDTHNDLLVIKFLSTKD